MMKLGVVGLWHLGTVTAACAAAAGVTTIGIDHNPLCVERLTAGSLPVFEPGLADLVQNNLASGALSFTSELAGIERLDVLWVCHDTPVDDEDQADVESVLRKVRATFPYLRDDAVVLVSAQLPVGSVAELERSFAAV